MGSSAVFRRWSSGVGVLKYRMMSTVTTAPWLMLPTAVDGGGNIAYTFEKLANKEEVSYKRKMMSGCDMMKDVRFVGSSHGWIALHNLRNKDLFLTNPITDRRIKLPPPPSGELGRVILSSSPEEEGCLAFMIVNGWAGFCSPCHRSSNEWSFFGNKHEYGYDDIVYSSKHKRIFCVSCGCAILEGWDFEGENPRLDWAIQHHEMISYSEYPFEWKFRHEFKRCCDKLNYLVCADERLYLVVRHVNPIASPYGSFVEKVVLSQYNGFHFLKTPYKTSDFDVFEIDWKRGNVNHMEDSLEGLAMFVGSNHSFAVGGAAGVKPNSIYFADDDRLVEPTRMERVNYGGHDNGIFDYQNKDFSSCCTFYPIEYHQIRKVLPLPLWFTPNF